MGVFLESGFNNILDAATHHPMAAVGILKTMHQKRGRWGGDEKIN